MSTRGSREVFAAAHLLVWVQSEKGELSLNPTEAHSYDHLAISMPRLHNLRQQAHGDRCLPCTGRAAHTLLMSAATHCSSSFRGFDGNARGVQK